MEDNCEYIQITDYIISDNIPYRIYIYTIQCTFTLIVADEQKIEIYNLAIVLDETYMCVNVGIRI